MDLETCGSLGYQGPSCGGWGARPRDGKRLARGHVRHLDTSDFLWHQFPHLESHRATRGPLNVSFPLGPNAAGHSRPPFNLSPERIFKMSWSLPTEAALTPPARGRRDPALDRGPWVSTHHSTCHAGWPPAVTKVCGPNTLAWALVCGRGSANRC